MNRQKTSKKSIIITVSVIAVLALVYFYYSGSIPSLSGTLSSDSTTNNQVGAEVLALLNQIQSLRIDTTLFKDPGYLNLVDHTVVIPQQNVGRDNPFAPVPGMMLQIAPAITGH